MTILPRCPIRWSRSIVGGFSGRREPAHSGMSRPLACPAGVKARSINLPGCGSLKVAERRSGKFWTFASTDTRSNEGKLCCDQNSDYQVNTGFSWEEIPVGTCGGNLVAQLVRDANSS